MKFSITASGLDRIVYRATIRALKDYEAAKNLVKSRRENMRECFADSEGMEAMARGVKEAEEALRNLGQ